MDVREKLVELLREVQYLGGLEEKIADHLIAHGVTVSGEIEELRADNNRLRDMWAKAVSDLSKATVHSVTVQDNTEISDELLEQLRNTPVTVMTEEPTVETVQEWISVKDWLPELSTQVIGLAQRNPFAPFLAMQVAWVGNGWASPVTGCYLTCTHWMPLPKLPKGE